MGFTGLPVFLGWSFDGRAVLLGWRGLTEWVALDAVEGGVALVRVGSTRLRVHGGRVEVA